MPENKKQVVKGPLDGNIFCIMGDASREMKRAGMHEEAEEMKKKVMNSGSYAKALGIITDYVELDV